MTTMTTSKDVLDKLLSGVENPPEAEHRLMKHFCNIGNVVDFCG
jgi:hypothetical protein